MRTTVGDLFREPSPLRPNQELLGDVVLGTMSAKLWWAVSWVNWS